MTRRWGKATHSHPIGKGLLADLTRARIHEDHRIVCFHGDGGVDGSPAMLGPLCQLLGRSGRITTAAVGYRTLNRDGATLDNMLADAVHALDWARTSLAPHARLHVLGASFGGLLALHAVLAKPAHIHTLILLNPVTDTGPDGFSNRVVPATGRPDISPLRVYAGHPILQRLHCLIGHGDADAVVPISASERFAALWPAGRCRLVTYHNARHGFFHKPPRDQLMAAAILDFLTDLAPPP